MNVGLQLTYDHSGLNSFFSKNYKPKRVVFNNPYTIAYFDDGAKIVAKCNAEKFDEEKGVMACIIKHLYGNRSEFLRVIENAERPIKVEKKSENCVYVTNNKIYYSTSDNVE